jgi:GcrA cell cycle regulator
MKESPLPRSAQSTQSRWSDARIRQLRQRWSKGASASRIARELGGGLSRNAVLGKLRRLGLVAVDRGRRRRSARDDTRAASLHLLPGHAISSHLTWIVAAEPYADDPATDASIPAAQRRSFLDLDSQSCRWPVGDPASPDFFFCGAQPLVDKPYCAEHCARAYRVQEAPACGSRTSRAMPHRPDVVTSAEAGDATRAHKSRAGERQ